MYQDQVKSRWVMIGQNTAKKLLRRINPETIESWKWFWKNISNGWEGDMVYPSNVLHMATECYNRGHPQQFHIALPEFFIKLLQ